MKTSEKHVAYIVSDSWKQLFFISFFYIAMINMRHVSASNRNKVNYLIKYTIGEERVHSFGMTPAHCLGVVSQLLLCTSKVITKRIIRPSSVLELPSLYHKQRMP